MPFPVTIPPPRPAGSPGEADVELPRRFGRYTLLRRRATGGMAELFVARQDGPRGFERRVVIKRVLPSLGGAADRDLLAGLLAHEARVMADLAHSGVVQVLDAGEVDGVPFIALEHVEGEDLRSLVRQMNRRRMTELGLGDALSIVGGLCAALAHVHERRALDGTPLGIVHRDVSPQNILVTYCGEVKLADFGVASSRACPSSDTRPARPRGKLPYMSPEQARGEDLDGRSDVFSAGVLLFELTTGRRLFKASDERATLQLILESEYPRPSEVRPGYPRGLEAIALRALARDRGERWASARELQGALEDFARAGAIALGALGLTRLMDCLFEEERAVEARELAEATRLSRSLV